MADNNHSIGASAPLNLDDLFTIEQLARLHKGKLTESTIKWQLRDRATNGLAFACVKIGRRVMISKTRYEQWLTSRAERAVA